jgi:hypothetical protein
MKARVLPPGLTFHGWFDSFTSLEKHGTFTCAVRGWFGIRRDYAVGISVDYFELKTVPNVVGIKCDVAALSMRDKIEHDQTVPSARWNAATDDFVRWSQARWDLIDKYAEPIR